MTVQEAYREGLERLRDAGIADAAFDCACLLEGAAGVTRTKRLAYPQMMLIREAEQRFFDMISRRADGEPLQYILGQWSFYGRAFTVGDGVLIPRPETEELVALASERIRETHANVVFDLCAGSGCIGLTLALENPESFVYLIEKYASAFAYLKKNHTDLKVTNAQLIQADIGDFIFESNLQVDILVSNPPYVPRAEIPDLQREVQREPSTALDGGADGLDFYRLIADQWLPYVHKGGEILLECGDGQGAAVAALFRDKTAQQQVLFDGNHIDRIVHIIV